MWNAEKFMRNFPMPSQCTPEQRKLINRYFKLWNKHLEQSIRENREAAFIRHCYDNAFFDSWQ